MRLIIAFFLGVVFILSVAATSQGVEAGPIKISGDWLVDVRTFCAVGAVVLGGTWWLGRYMQKTEDRLEAIERNALGRDEMLVEIQHQLRELARERKR